MNEKFAKRIQEELAGIEAAGLMKKERIITSEQGPEIVVNGKTVLNFCANNYLGLSSHPKVIEAAHKAIDSHGYGMSSVRFICGTQDIHKQLEQKIADFWEQKIPFYMPLHLMPTAVYSNLCLMKKMPSLVMH